jgi:hypothetical protein
LTISPGSSLTTTVSPPRLTVNQRTCPHWGFGDPGMTFVPQYGQRVVVTSHVSTIVPSIYRTPDPRHDTRSGSWLRSLLSPISTWQPSWQSDAHEAGATLETGTCSGV